MKIHLKASYDYLDPEDNCYLYLSDEQVDSIYCIINKSDIVNDIERKMVLSKKMDKQEFDNPQFKTQILESLKKLPETIYYRCTYLSTGIDVENLKDIVYGEEADTPLTTFYHLLWDISYYDGQIFITN